MAHFQLGSALVLALALLFPESVFGQCGGGGGGMGTGTAGRAAVTSRYLKDSDATIVSVGPVGQRAGTMRLTAAYECSGKAACVPDGVRIVVTGLSLERSSLPDESPAFVFALDDGRSIEAADAHVQAQETLGHVVITTIPTEEFLQIARDKAVEVRYGATNVSLSKQQREALRELAKRIEKAAPRRD